MLLKDKVIIITGVGPGMGQAMAKIAAQEGAKVAIGARKKEFLDKVVDEIKAAGGQAIAVATDVSKQDQCDALAAATIKAFGRIDGLVNSAYAPGEMCDFDSANIESWKDSIDVSCLGAVRMAKAVVPQMKKQGGGAIVNVATMQAQQHLAGGSLSYAVAKGAMVTASRQLASELGPFNIRVNATRMGWLWGEPVRNALEGMAQHTGTTVDAIKQGVASKIALRVIPPEEECAKTVLMFVSDYTKMVAGGVLDVNGGEWMAP
jgi:NAD(P)-dependent dehydrogenase (short-subunit alcohol dehydrogenase family)